MKSSKAFSPFWRKPSLRMEFTMIVTTITLVILMVSLYLFLNINLTIGEIDAVYDSNLKLNDMTSTINLVQENMTTYLNTKSTDSMENYYRYKQELKTMAEELNGEASADPVLLSEKNIRSLVASYLEETDQAIEAKRGRNLEKYKAHFESSTRILGYVTDYIESLNNTRFKENMRSYETLSKSLGTMEAFSIGFFLLIAAVGIILVSIICNTVTIPLRNLAQAAEQVAGGNYDVELKNDGAQDEVGVLTNAFRTMVISIQENIVRLRENMEKEQQMKEKELMMESHLKDAHLKYLQAQINPHFLFNTLNAGAQLAMMEGADRAYEYIQQVASFFRYNIRKDNDVVSLKEEIELVDTYIYILNVRFAGDIGYEKEIEDPELLELPVPSMILQPVVENSVNYGIRNMAGEGVITLSVFREGDHVCVSIRDNGAGMTQERIRQVLENRAASDSPENDSNGIGLHNVISRLELMYEEEGPVEIFSEGEGRGTEVILHIPGEKEYV